MSVVNTMLRGLDERARREGRKGQLGDAVQATAPESAVTGKRMLLVIAAGLGGAALATGVWLYLQGILAPKLVAIPAPPPPVLAAAQPGATPGPAPADADAKSEVAPVTMLPATRAAATLASAPVAAPTVPAGPAQAVKPVAPAPVGAVTALSASAPTPSSAAPAAASDPLRLSPDTVAAQTAGGKTYSRKQVAGNLMAEAVALDREGRLDEAKQPLRQVLAANPDDLAARQMLVQLHIDTGHLDQARELLEAGLQQQPANPALAWTLARLKAESGDVSGAITLLDGVRDGGRDDPQLYAFQGALLLRSQRYADAVQAYLAALRADPANPSWLLGAGAALEGVGKTADALEAYQRAEGVAGLTSEQAAFVSSRLTRLRR